MTPDEWADTLDYSKPLRRRDVVAVIRAAVEVERQACASLVEFYQFDAPDEVRDALKTLFAKAIIGRGNAKKVKT